MESHNPATVSSRLLSSNKFTCHNMQHCRYCHNRISSTSALKLNFSQLGSTAQWTGQGARLEVSSLSLQRALTTDWPADNWPPASCRAVFSWWLLPVALVVLLWGAENSAHWDSWCVSTERGYDPSFLGLGSAPQSLLRCCIAMISSNTEPNI
jgi:hypothetical protein